ncbi:MAG TPA: transposase [Porticoccaceae bacterium]|nr:transposase [Porticoccaceae bacterium]
MPRANRYFIPGHVWHITHRCHRSEFLLKFTRDRKRWRYWLFEAKKRFGLSVLNYTVTSNHIHLLVKDTGKDVIPKSMQLIAGRTAQEYNQRKNRKGAFWEDRYHATAIDTEGYLAQCLVYIDMNMVRAGVVSHPSSWANSGYQEIQNPINRYSVIDYLVLMELLGINNLTQLQSEHQGWVEAELKKDSVVRKPLWSQSLAVGSHAYVQGVKKELGVSAKARQIETQEGLYRVKEPRGSYLCDFDSQNSGLSNYRQLFLDES